MLGVSKIIEVKKDVEANDKFKKDSMKDPYLSLGFGFIAYRDLLEQLIICFTLLSIFIYPVAQIYKQGGAYTMDADIQSGSLYSLGNLGYSSVQCQLASFEIDKFPMQCPFGTISDIVPNGIGINEQSLKDENDKVIQDYC